MFLATVPVHVRTPHGIDLVDPGSALPVDADSLDVARLLAHGAVLAFDPEPQPSLDWRKADLLDYAAARGITVPDGTKAEILAAILQG